MKGKKLGIEMKHFFAGLGAINFASYLIALGLGLAPLFHIFIIRSEVSFGKIVLSIIAILLIIILTIARIYRRFFYVDQFDFLQNLGKPYLSKKTNSAIECRRYLREAVVIMRSKSNQGLNYIKKTLKEKSGTKVLASQLSLDCLARCSG